MKKVAILQSNYVPWKGYFDMIALVDEFILYDDVQYTKNDWRNRNKIKTQNGTHWLTIPTGKDLNRKVSEVDLPDARWQRKHWASISQSYSKAPCFAEYRDDLGYLYSETEFCSLSQVNETFIRRICDSLGIDTDITSCDDYDYANAEDPTARLVEICRQADADTYVSGRAAEAYLDQIQFEEAGIEIVWMDYSGYPEYPQLWGDFVHEVTVLDLLFNCGNDAPRFMKYVAEKQ